MPLNNSLGLAQHVVKIMIRGEWQGQGVVVANGYVLTAAHCLPAPESNCFVSEDLLILVRLPDGREGIMKPGFVDAVEDLAALYPSDRNPFLLDGVPPLPVSLNWSKVLSTKDMPELPGAVFTHNAEEVEIQYKEHGGGSSWYTATRRVIGGTSGGPIVNEYGHLIGIVCQTGDTDDKLDEPEDDPDPIDQVGRFRMLGAALPPWLAMTIQTPAD